MCWPYFLLFYLSSSGNAIFLQYFLYENSRKYSPNLMHSISTLGLVRTLSYLFLGEFFRKSGIYNFDLKKKRENTREGDSNRGKYAKASHTYAPHSRVFSNHYKSFILYNFPDNFIAFCVFFWRVH